MGKSRMTRYRLLAGFLDFKAKCYRQDVFGSDMKNPTPKKLAEWRSGMNKSMEPGGVNHKLAERSSPYGTVICIDQRTNQEVCRYTPPTFEIVK